MGIFCLSIESSVGHICILAVTGMLKPHIRILSMIFQSAFVALMLTYKGPKCCSNFIFQLESLTEWCWISFEGDETFGPVQTSLLPLKNLVDDVRPTCWPARSELSILGYIEKSHAWAAGKTGRENSLCIVGLNIAEMVNESGEGKRPRTRLWRENSRNFKFF